MTHIFIAGMSKSGTTTLFNLLGKHQKNSLAVKRDTFSDYTPYYYFEKKLT